MKLHMLNRAFAKTARDLPALFLVLASVLLPIHLAHSFAFRNVAGVLELRSEIAEFPGERQVRSVGKAQLKTYDISYWLIVLAELAAIPIAARAARHVVSAGDRDEPQSIADAWRAARDRSTGPRMNEAGRHLGVLGIAALVALLTGALVWHICMPFAVHLPPGSRFVIVGATEAIARAAGAPFLLVAISEAARAGPQAAREPRLY